MVLGSFLAITDMVIILCMCIIIIYAQIKKTIDHQKRFYYRYFFCFNSTLTRSQTTESKKQLPLFQQNVITHSQPGPKGSEVIGWRLATQESGSGFHFTKELSPAVLSKSPWKGQYRYGHACSNWPSRLDNFKLL